MTITTEPAIREPAALSTQRRVGRRHQSASKVVAIVGAGFSGTMTAIQLRHALPPDWIIVLLDRTGRFARGPAYTASDAPHLLNVCSVNMSAVPDDPGRFERWLGGVAARWTNEVQVTEAGSFASRRLYRRYLRALLYDEMTQSGGRVRLCSDDVRGLFPAQNGWQPACASGR